MSGLTNWVSLAIGLVIAVLVITYASIAKNYYASAGTVGQGLIQQSKSYNFDNSLVDAGLWVGVGYIVVVLVLGGMSIYEKRKGGGSSGVSGGGRYWY